MMESPNYYKSNIKPTWCPGCGDFGVLTATIRSFAELGWAREDIVAVSGIGCSSRFPFFLQTYGFHSIHGRALPVATGIKTARPDLHVVAYGGDGDGFAIGAGHFLHAARRNVDIAYIVMDNHIYGLTKGQTSPTSGLDFKTKSTPYGNVEFPVHPLVTALACGATYVARGLASDPKHLKELFMGAMTHRGFAMVDVLSPCVTYNKVDTFKSFKENSCPVPDDHDTSNLLHALKLALDAERHYTGLIYKEEKPTVGDYLDALKSKEDRKWTEVVEEVFRSMA
jgi:2-oxoglutarate ferredoxin oxidoreductase subunit beta